MTIQEIEQKLNECQKIKGMDRFMPDENNEEEKYWFYKILRELWGIKG